MSALYAGDPKDVPHVIFDAIRMALVFLSWEELPKEDQPPRSIWLDGERLKEHFAAVKRRQDERYGTNGAKAIEDPVENALIKDLIPDG